MADSDRRILGTALAVRAAVAPRTVILVSKDTNLRMKAKSLGLVAEDLVPHGQRVPARDCHHPPPRWTRRTPERFPAGSDSRRLDELTQVGREA